MGVIPTSGIGIIRERPLNANHFCPAPLSPSDGIMSLPHHAAQAPFTTVTPQQDCIDLVCPHFSLLKHCPPNMQVPSSRRGEDHCWFGFRGGKRMREIQANACSDWQFSLGLSVSCGPGYGNVHQGGGFDPRSLRKPFHNYRESAEIPQIQIVNDIPGTRFLL